MDLSIIVPPLVGSVIGYSTNWLAIKMLFKPHRAYHIGKMRIPFTPGLIPRERDRIAKSLGTTVGKNLLTEEVILKELTNDTITGSLKEFLVHDLLGKEFTINELIKGIDDDGLLKEKMVTSIKKGLTNALVDNIEVKQSLSTAIGNYASSDSSMKQILGEGAFEGVEGLLFDNKTEIANAIALYLADEQVSGKIKGIINRIMMDKLGGLAAMFMDPANLYQSILEFVRSGLEKEENQIELVTQISLAVNKFTSKPVGEIVDSEEYGRIVDNLSGYTLNAVGKLFESEDSDRLINGLLDQFLDMRIVIPEDMKEALENKVVDMYLDFARTRLPIFIEQMNISKIVEGEINGFSTQEVENLIFGIVDRELKAITWLGALLGFIMGCFTLLA